MKNTIELDTKILNKNLEITKLTTQLDNLTSDYVDLKERIKSPFILNTLQTCHDILDPNTNQDYFNQKEEQDIEESLRKDLRKVITFLQNPNQYNTR